MEADAPGCPTPTNPSLQNLMLLALSCLCLKGTDAVLVVPRFLDPPT